MWPPLSSTSHKLVITDLRSTFSAACSVPYVRSYSTWCVLCGLHAMYFAIYSNCAFQHGLGACNDSLCLPCRPTLSITIRTSNTQTVGVRQQNTVPGLPGSINITSTFDLSRQHLLRQASIRHPTDMTIPPKPLASQLKLNRKGSIHMCVEGKMLRYEHVW